MRVAFAAKGFECLHKEIRYFHTFYTNPSLLNFPEDVHPLHTVKVMRTEQITKG